MKNNLKKLFISALVLVGILSGIYEAYASTIPIAPAVFETSLQSAISTSSTSMTLAYGTLANGSTLSGYACFTIDSGNPNVEFICGTASGTSVTSLLRGVDTLTGNTSVSSLIFSHRRGADVKITDFPVFSVVRNIINGGDTLPNPITYAAGISPVANQDLATKAYVLSVVSGGTVTTNAVTITGKAGETVAAGNLLYFKTADGLWYKTSASTASTVNNTQLGISQGAGTVGNSITGGILIRGVDTNNTGTGGSIVYASNTSGALSTSAGTTERAVGQYLTASGGLYFDPNFYYLPTADQKAAVAGGGNFGTPSSSNKFITESYNSSASALPIVRTYIATSAGSSTTQFDVTLTGGTTYRYTYDGTGTDPNISAATVPIGTTLQIYSTNLTAGNRGSFTITGSGANYFEVTNAGGVAENNKTLGATGYLYKGQTWTKPAGLKYIEVETIGAGGAGGAGVGANGSGGGGGGGGYAKKLIATSGLSSTEFLSIGAGGLAGTGDGGTGNSTNFSSYISATGGVGGEKGDQTGTDNGAGGAGGVGSSGDINSNGSGGGGGNTDAGAASILVTGGVGGSSFYGGGAPSPAVSAAGVSGTAYGGGGSGGSSGNGGGGATGLVVVTEHYN